MSLQLKDASVCVESRTQSLRPEMLFALGVAQEIFSGEGCDCIVTSALDGKHNPASLHARGLAVDLRTLQLSNDQRRIVVQKLSERLRKSGFDVVLEEAHATGATTAPHIHIEYDPKGKPFWNVLHT